MGTKTQKLSNVVDQIVEWQSVFTGDGSTGLTAVAGRGYFIDTTSGTVTVTTPASPKQGDKITIVDYAGTFATNNVTINFNGAKVFGASNTGTLATNFQVIDIIYIDSTQGWRTVNQDTTSDIQTESFISATGGTVTTSGDYKIHTFTGDGCFVVSSVGNPAGGGSDVDYLVVAGGGGGGLGPGPADRGAGAGAGGFRESHSTCNSGPYTASPLATPTGVTVSVTTYPITVGSGGSRSVCNAAKGSPGSNSIFSTITSAGGGGGASGASGQRVGLEGGSGGGGGSGGIGCTGGAGNTPPVSPPQGNNGGFGGGGCISSPNIEAGAGGGAGAVGGNATPGQGGDGGDGVGTLINPATGVPGPSCLQYYAGGGGAPGNGQDEALGGGGISDSQPNVSGDANSGGGGAGSFSGPGVDAGSGGKGIVIIRYKFQ